MGVRMIDADVFGMILSVIWIVLMASISVSGFRDARRMRLRTKRLKEFGGFSRCVHSEYDSRNGCTAYFRLDMRVDLVTRSFDNDPDWAKGLIIQWHDRNSLEALRRLLNVSKL